MINHVRTTLIDLAPAVIPVPGEEYVPAGYRPAPLRRNLADARAALFGPGADRAGYNLTAARILTYLHASRFAADLTRNDLRLTYDPYRPGDVWGSLGATTKTTGGFVDPVGWSGVAAFRASGRSYGEWIVATDGAGGYTVLVSGGQSVSGTTTPMALGDAVPLTGSTLSIVVPSGIAGQWLVTLLAPSGHNWASAANFEPDAVFNPQASRVEAGWFSVWSDLYAPAPLRAGTLALALAARTSELVAARSPKSSGS